jgi:uncharacterized SAM-binding protein YcdF (DUF218 family)
MFENIHSWGSKFLPQAKAPQAIVVLGQSLNQNGSPPKTLLARVREAILLYSHHKVPLLLCGGDPAETGVTEAETMSSLIIKSGIPVASIFLETRSKNTVQNAWYVVDVLRKHRWSHIILVTSDFHIPRAVLYFEAVFVERKALITIQRGPAVGGFETAYSAGTSGVNYFSWAQRIEMELDFLVHYVNKTCATDMPGHPITPPTDKRVQMAITEVESLVENA